MKTIRILKWVFLAIGGVLLLIAIAIYSHQRSFVSRAWHASGEVVELLAVTGNDSTTYKPVVRFKGRDDREVTFSSSVSSSPPAYSVGEKVGVLYEPSNPQSAQIDGFSSLWLGVTIVGGLAVVFAGIGGGIMIAGRLGAEKKAYLLAHGTPVLTDLQGVERNESLTVNGRHPWRIVSQWLDPRTAKLRVFNSENLWFDPEKFLTGRQITVLLDPKDHQRYHMDVSFLPQMEE